MIKMTSNVQFKTEVLDETKVPVLVDFSASWCPPCKVLKPILEKFSKEVEGKLKVVYVDVEESEGLSQQYNILAMPTLILMKEGKEVSRKLGNQSLAELKEFTGV